MSRTSIKKRSVTSSLALTAFCKIVTAHSVAMAASYGVEVNFDTRYGIHTYGAPTVATNRHTLQFDQTAKFNDRWSGIIGFRAETEAAYAADLQRYQGTDALKYDSQTFLPRDNYLQYRNGGIQIRAGYQQVVWGEAFGAYYADIVNPKDFREAGLGDLSRNRISTPILNTQWIGGSSSVQLLYIPFVQPSLLPSSGSDFSFVAMPTAFANYKLVMATSPSEMPKTGEAGIRITKQIYDFDFSAFYLNYHDRSPIYVLTTPTAPLTLNAEPQYRPLQSAGLTMTVDLGGFLVRAEVLEHLDRMVNVFTASTFTAAKTNELIYVLGLDLPPLAKWQLGIQYSESRLPDTPLMSTGEVAAWALRDGTQQVITARIAKTFEGDLNAELLATQFLSDDSNLLQAKLTIPIADQFEFIVGADNFDGIPSSQLGRFKPANRAWVQLKAFLKK